jgi:hypothetical protein
MSENPGVAEEKETERRRDEALRRALSMLPKPHKGDADKAKAAADPRRRDKRPEKGSR